jgi:aspartate kinase
MTETRTQTRDVLLPILEAGRVAIITGFIGGTADGKITTLGRGGSDYSAGIVGACLDSEEVWIWTDVDGVMSADPRVVSDARSIRELTYREVSELAYFGAKVLHPRTLRPLADVPLRVKNTFNAAHPGTLVIPDIARRSPESIRFFKAVTAIRSMAMLVVAGKGMLGVPGIAARTFGAVARTGTSVLLISQSSSEQSICFIVPANSVAEVQLALDEEFKQELARGDIDSINCMPDINIVTVVGEGMRNIPGIAGRVFTATGANGINVIAIAQGSSECSISLVVDADAGDDAVRAIHALAAD